MQQETVLTQAPLVGARTHEGAVGKQNEDAYAYFKLGPGPWGQDPATSIYVAVVADGVTGKFGGAKASDLAVKTIKSVLQSKAQTQPLQEPAALHQAVDEAIVQAHEEIRRVARQNPELGNMSTTLVLAVLNGNQLSLAHLGDSRAYLVRDGQIHRLTLDHSWVQDALDQNKMNAEEVKRHPNRNVIQRYLGIRDHVEIDYNIVIPGTYEFGSQRSHANQISLAPGDVVLLCSDGQIDNVSEQALLQAITAHRHHPEQAAEKLIELALAQHEEDNVTSVLLSLANGRSLAFWPSRFAWAAIAAALVVLIVVVTLMQGFMGGTPAAVTPTALPLAVAPTVPQVTPTLALATATPLQVAAHAPTATVTLAPTASETASPAATDTDTPTPSLTHTPTLAPTDTLLPASTATPLPTSTPLPTATTQPTATRRSEPASAPSPTSASAVGPVINGSISLISPSDNANVKDKQTFEWKANLTLDPAHAFELIFWKPDGDPLRDGLGVAGTTRDTRITVDFAAVNTTLGNKFSPGKYLWAVRLVKINPYDKTTTLSEVRRLQFELTTGGSNDSKPSCNPDKETC